ncbi:uncharacterized protein LOC108580473 [Papio anubis]|uniref:uncharacterized protein LOC108580473 n=1 Tax=Papio anubis TaxID=9555 RepID=UPI0012ADF281|nr:uncharacterized protein LOC108580473 [Papio anubis]XP_031508440.1 uncharacterized protein LOC108580473 [Papio anubis]XP_031508441.1 uncharacterized protein LOC108580473 [Papio anubis]XP_031508442.1 uncharacterized protein LOC108580473 [Papio anubis]XP_031508443.1 uncharacterized protein LOC108580473 [Papio anubis]XP_031508444.1 uncharacterized protein LOC108580473 [Papio anubis]
MRRPPSGVGRPGPPRHPRPGSWRRAGRRPGAARDGGDPRRARLEAPGAPTTRRPPRAPAWGLTPPGARAAKGRTEAAQLVPEAARKRRPPPSPACRAPAARGLTASTACCRMEVNLENILSRDCSSLSRDDLESSSIRRRRPCCGCRGRSRVKAGAGRGGPAEDRGRAWPGRFRCALAARRLWRAPGRGGGEEGVRLGLGAPGSSGGGSGWDTVAARLRFLPPALPAAACRGRRRGPGRPGQACPAAGPLDAAGAGRGGRGEASASPGAGGGLGAATALSRLSQRAWDTGFLTFLQLSGSQEFCFSSGSNRLTL